MPREKYQRLDQALSNSSEEHLSDYDEPLSWIELQKTSLARAWKIVYTLVVLLGFAIVSNGLLWAKLRSAERHIDNQGFVGLERNIPMTIPHDERTLDDPMWDSPEFDWNPGWVALEDSLTEAKGLPTAMHWPWDESKSIYLIHGFHSMHCVFVLRDTIMEYRDGKKQTWDIGHITHCLHVLREDITCNADDTMRYTGRLHALENETKIFSGVGQTRMCRDWNQLREFAAKNSACYVRPIDHYVPLLDRYKNCPDGSKPWEKEE